MVWRQDISILAVAVAAFLLALVLGYGLHRRMEGIASEITELRAVAAQVDRLEGRALDVEGAAVRLGSLPRKTRSMAVENQVGVMAAAADDLSRTLGPAHADKLRAVQVLLEDVRKDLRTAP